MTAYLLMPEKVPTTIKVIIANFVMNTSATPMAPMPCKCSSSSTPWKVDMTVRIHDSNVRSFARSVDVWERRAAARQRQLDIGKGRPEYETYCQEVERLRRGVNDPATPDPSERISKRKFDRKLSGWRRMLHDYDQGDQGEGADVLGMLPNKDLSPCTESTRASSDGPVSPSWPQSRSPTDAQA
eukprot:CAMPEP_0183481140 /NCGR_PEP_ID=MMETSP0370-20130417/174416_1 /TAXON_ID=268820 /ORGANISM="Peridinium aciculiferum, Strain PAER-2" /LENGTH=183 /DNA_ID=CAMNT_0025674249 /DNA_START=115 /DNA_END=662 /DNA_ORIENTATION=+